MIGIYGVIILFLFIFHNFLIIQFHILCFLKNNLFILLLLETSLHSSKFNYILIFGLIYELNSYIMKLI